MECFRFDDGDSCAPSALETSTGFVAVNLSSSIARPCIASMTCAAWHPLLSPLPFLSAVTPAIVRASIEVIIAFPERAANAAIPTAAKDPVAHSAPP